MYVTIERNITEQSVFRHPAIALDLCHLESPLVLCIFTLIYRLRWVPICMENLGNLRVAQRGSVSVKYRYLQSCRVMYRVETSLRHEHWSRTLCKLRLLSSLRSILFRVLLSAQILTSVGSDAIVKVPNRFSL